MPAQTALTLARYEPGSRMAPHEHETPSLSLVMAGDYAECVGRSERRYTVHTIVFCPAGRTHSQSFGSRGARQILITPQDDWLDYLADCKLDLSGSPHARATDFGRLGKRLLAECREDDEFAAIAREGILLEIVAAFGRQKTRESSSGAVPAWLRRTEEFLRENAFSAVTMARIASVAGRHKIHVAREFRRHYCMTIGTYQRQIRTEQAARFLLQSGSSISEIAQACGFASHAHLCREFKRQFGMTPSHYRAVRR